MWRFINSMAFDHNIVHGFATGLVMILYTEVDARFDLVYPTGDVSEYVLVRGIPEMRAFTLCLWLRTEDVMKYGTLASYAVHNNTLRAHDVRADVITLVDYGLLRVRSISNNPTWKGLIQGGRPTLWRFTECVIAYKSRWWSELCRSYEEVWTMRITSNMVVTVFHYTPQYRGP